MLRLSLPLQILRERRSRQESGCGLLLLLLTGNRTADHRMNGRGIVELVMSSSAAVLNAEKDRGRRHAAVTGADCRTDANVGRRVVHHRPVRRRRHVWTA